MEFSDKFNALPLEEQVKKLKQVVEWYEDYASCIPHRENDIACEYADEREAERLGLDSDSPEIDGIPNGLTMSDTDDE